MPGKEAVVEVETNGVVPEPVTKEIPKCESASKEVKGKKDGDPEAVKPAESAPVADSAEAAKPQDTEISSSEEQKPEKEDISDKTDDISDKTDEAEPSVDSVNGSGAKPQEKTEESPTEESTASDGKSKPDESPVEPKVEGSETVKSSEETPGAVAESEVEAKPAESEVEAKPAESEVEAKPAESEVEAKPAESEVEAKPAESSVDSKTAEKMEAMEADEIKSSEATPKPLPSDSEKIVVEKTSEPKDSSDVSGSDEAKTPTQDGCAENKENGSSSVDSSTEKPSDSETKTDGKTNGNPPSSETSAEEKPGSSSTTVEPDLDTQIAELRKKGVALYVGRDFCAAADTFGKLLEMAAPVYGEMSDKLAETYYMYGTSMFEYGKEQNDVLGEKVKEKDEEDKDEEGGDSEEMEVDAAAEPADSADKKPSDSDETKEQDDEQEEPADETITGEDKEDDEDDAFRVAWEMLELAKTTFQKAGNKKRLADTLMKLGDVGTETGDANAIEEMVEGLKVRKEVFPSNHRIIPETHFKIGVAFAYFEKYDEAIQHFTDAKDCLEKRIEELSKSETKEDKEEVEEMKSILPEIQEKIQDTKESKADKEKIKSTVGESSEEPETGAFPAVFGENKPVSNISHLVKRKRKVDEILPERAAKQSRQEGTADVASTTADEPEETKKSEETKPADSMDTSEPQNTEETKVVEVKQVAQPEETNPNDQTKPAEKEEEKSEDKPEAKSEEKSEAKPEEVKDEAQPEVKQSEETAEEPSKTEEVKPAEAEAKSDEPEKMEE